MKRSKFSEEQVAYALRQAERGTPVADFCCQLGVSEATFCICKNKTAHLGVRELRRMLTAGRGSGSATAPRRNVMPDEPRRKARYRGESCTSKSTLYTSAIVDAQDARLPWIGTKPRAAMWTGGEESPVASWCLPPIRPTFATGWCRT